MEQTARKTNAERQAAYRQKHLLEGTDERMNMVVSVSAKRQLERLSKHYGVTQRQFLESLLSETESDLVFSLSPSNQTSYYDSVTK